MTLSEAQLLGSIVASAGDRATVQGLLSQLNTGFPQFVWSSPSFAFTEAYGEEFSKRSLALQAPIIEVAAAT